MPSRTTTRLDVSDHAHEVRRALVNVAAVCEALGIARSKSEHGKFTCPRHGGGSLSVRLGKDRTIQARCFGCDFAGDVFTLIAEALGLSVSRDFLDVLTEGARIGGLWAIVGDLEARAGGRVPRVDPTPRGPNTAPRTPSPATNPERNAVASERSDAQTSERPYPPPDEVRELWAGCVPVSDVAQVREYLEGRVIAPAGVEALDLARAIPDGAVLPRWASYRGNAPEARPWLAIGFRLVLPVYDAGGVVRSVRGWRVLEGDGPKRLPPSGYRAGGLVMADGAGVALLERASLEGTDGRVVIVEGEPDFLTWATRFPDSAEAVPAVLGILSGSWTDEIAARIPDGARVIVRTHHDEAGNRYAAAVRGSIDRRCEVLRSKGP